MTRDTKKTIFIASVSIILLIIAGFDEFFVLRGQSNETYNALLESTMFLLSFSIYTVLLVLWMVSVNRRIMQNNLRIYLMALGINMLLWITIRVIKYYSFRFIALPDRLLWYAYYIPLTLIPLLFFFIALSVDKDENYRPSKYWNLLFIPAAILILLVFTNDLHKLFFILDFSKHAYAQYYDYGIGYYTYLLFFTLLCIATTYLLIKKSRTLKASGKGPFLPFAVLISIILYTIIYIIDYKILGIYLDLTVFSCMSAVFFFEACIITRLIPSNKNYDHFFKHSDIGAQIYDKTGNMRHASINSALLNDNEFKTLLTDGSISKGKSLSVKNSPINGGYINYIIDTTKVDNLIDELNIINSQLHQEVRLLNIEKKQREETLYLSEQKEMQDKLHADMLPHTAKIKERALLIKDASEDDKKRLLYEISVIGAYIKRAISLTLLSNTLQTISIKELSRVFEESFQAMRLSGSFCAHKIIKECDIPISAAIFSYSFFDALAELYSYKLDMIFQTFDYTEDYIKIAFQISGDIDDRIYSLLEFTSKSNYCQKIEILPETDGYFIALHLTQEVIL